MRRAQSSAMVTLHTLVVLVLGAACAQTPDSEAGGRLESEPIPLYTNLGDHEHQVTVRVAAAQAYFNQGLRLKYAFNHAESRRAFEEAARQDPSCAMCFWGIALATGPNINSAMNEERTDAAFLASQEALSLVPGVSPREQAYIEAMAARYSADPAAGRSSLDSAYAAAMRTLAAADPADVDAGVLYASALMNLQPWNYWTEELEPRPGTPEALGALEGALERRPNHAGACHYFIHAVEAAYPERAVPCAEKLPELMPGAGHILHMPAHIYIRVGRYVDAIERNVHAVHADEEFIDSHVRDKQSGTEYTLAYYPHNYDFLAFAASMAGRADQAIEAADQVAAHVDRSMLAEPGLGALQHYLGMPLRMRVRFGRWRAILKSPVPDTLAYPRATWHFAQGMALARTGKLEEAKTQLEVLLSLAADPSLEGVTIWDLNDSADLLAVAAQVLGGEIALESGNPETAIEHLREGVRLESLLYYDEPPDWSVPVRHYLGHALLRAGEPAEAQAVYEESLRRFPENGWSLTGLAASLDAQGMAASAGLVRERLSVAWRTADVEPATSRL